MNLLQSGTPSSGITPQGYKNSSQSGNLQSGYSGSDLLDSNSASYTLRSNLRIPLSVKSNNAQQVLGASRVTENKNVYTASPSNNYASVTVLALLVSAVLVAYFLIKLNNYARTVNALDASNPEE